MSPGSRLGKIVKRGSFQSERSFASCYGMNQELQSQFEATLVEFSAVSERLPKEASQLWYDAIRFFVESRRKRVSAERRARLWRATVLTAAAAFEGWTNFLAVDVVSNARLVARKLSEFEIDCLSEQRKSLRDRVKVDVEKGKLSSISRFALLYRILGNGELPDKLHSALKAAIGVRDALVHPKPGNSVDQARLREAFVSYWAADIALARVWEKARSRPPGPLLVTQ